MSLARGLESGPTSTLRWSAGSVAFELESADPRVLDQARIVFGPWLQDRPDSRPQARFVVAADESAGNGRWRVHRKGCEPQLAHSLDHALMAVEYGAIAALHEPDCGVVALHAALLSRDGRGLLIVGPKEAGKSTLACGLWSAGWRLHSDDNALIEPGPWARGIPRRVSLRETSRRQLGPELWQRILDLPGTTPTRTGILFHPGPVGDGRSPARVPVLGILFLARRGATAGPGRLEPLEGARTLLALAPYSNRREAGYGPALRDLRELADRAPAYDLGRGELGTMVERAAEVVGP